MSDRQKSQLPLGDRPSAVHSAKPGYYPQSVCKNIVAKIYISLIRIFFSQNVKTEDLNL